MSKVNQTYLPVDQMARSIPVFTPDPAKSVRLTLDGSGVATWTPPAGSALFRWSPTSATKVTLNANTAGITFGANPDLPYGPDGIHGDTASIKFTGTVGAFVDIEVM